MDQKSTYLQKHQVPELIDRLICQLVDEMPADPRSFLADQLAAQADSKYQAKDNMPAYKTGDKDNHFPVLVASALQADVYGRLYKKKTLSGVSLEDLLADGVNYNYQVPEAAEAKPNAPISGIFVGDEQSYEVFGSLIDAVVAAKHGSGVPAKVYQHDTSLGKVTGGFTFDANVIAGGVVRLKRNLKGYRFTTAMTRAERRALNALVAQQTKNAFGGNARLAGNCVDYSGKATQEGLPRACQSLNVVPVPSAHAAGARREWPDCRAIHCGSEGTFFVLVGSAEEHVELVSVAGEGCNIREAFDHAMEGSTLLNEALKKCGNEFAHGDRYGYLTSNIDYLGCGMIVEVTAKIPALSAAPEFKDVLTKLNLHAEATGNTEATDPTHKLTNTVTLVKSEAEILQAVVTALEKVVELEGKAAKGEALKGQF